MQNNFSHYILIPSQDSKIAATDDFILVLLELMLSDSDFSYKVITESIVLIIQTLHPIAM